MSGREGGTDPTDMALSVTSCRRHPDSSASALIFCASFTQSRSFEKAAQSLPKVGPSRSRLKVGPCCGFFKKSAQSRSKVYPKSAQSWAPSPGSRPQVHPSRPQGGSKSAQRWLKSAQSWPKVCPNLPQSWPTVSPGSARSPPGVGPKSVQSWPKVGTKSTRPKVGQKLLQSWLKVG